MRISDWSSDVCSSDLPRRSGEGKAVEIGLLRIDEAAVDARAERQRRALRAVGRRRVAGAADTQAEIERRIVPDARSEEHTSELQSLMRISYAVFCLKKKKSQKTTNNTESYIVV